MDSIGKHIVRFILLLFLQVLLINNLHWLGLVHPYIYVFFLLMLPVALPRWAEMLLGVITGCTMDMFCSTPGVHMAACVAVTYLRPILLARLVQDSQRIATQVCSATIGDWPFISLASLLTVLHHGLVFILEAWSWQHVWWTLLGVLISSLISIVLVVLYDRMQQ